MTPRIGVILLDHGEPLEYNEHTLYYIVEADDYDTVEKFLTPGFKRCRATITPVSRFFGE
jgi:hypothetical protein